MLKSFCIIYVRLSSLCFLKVIFQHSLHEVSNSLCTSHANSGNSFSFVTNFIAVFVKSYTGYF